MPNCHHRLLLVMSPSDALALSSVASNHFRFLPQPNSWLLPSSPIIEMPSSMHLLLPLRLLPPQLPTITGSPATRYGVHSYSLPPSSLHLLFHIIIIVTHHGLPTRMAIQRRIARLWRLLRIDLLPLYRLRPCQPSSQDRL